MDHKYNLSWNSIARPTIRKVCIAAFLLTTTPLSWASENMPTASPESVGMSSERLGRIDEFFQRF
ncbi:MAG: hypothetical protein HOD87_09565, partial [Gammaproteobacteria bacterium]|nr:hypothetical protein [Gammaproteobacteria bacterium]